MHNLTYNIILWIPVLMLMFQHQDECFKDDPSMRIFVNNQRMLYFSYKQITTCLDLMTLRVMRLRQLKGITIFSPTLAQWLY
jgi:hypothetical protein